MDGGPFDEAVREGQEPFQKEGGELEPAKPEETATPGEVKPETDQPTGSEPEETPTDDEPKVSPRATERFRELSRRNRELEEKIAGIERSFEERLKQTTTPQGKELTDEEKYLQELAEYMYNYTQSKLTASQKAEVEAQQKMDETIKGELRELSLDYEDFDPQKALEYSLKYGTSTLKQGYEIYLEAQAARAEAKKEVVKAEPRKRAAGTIAGSTSPSGRRGVSPEDIKKKSFAEIRDEIYEEFGR